jgi:glutamine amidotransferase
VIALIDYGAGNLTSVRKGLAAAGAPLYTPGAPADLADASAVVVPGVGHFSATRALGDPWRAAILERVNAGLPLLGICLGMHWLYEGSEEDSEARGLSLIRGTCSRLPPDRKVPHVGWNTLVAKESTLLKGIANETYVYFAHSYAAPAGTACTAFADHGVRFAAVVECGSVFGVQFHPEKSGSAGIQILKNFVSLAQPR